MPWCGKLLKFLDFKLHRGRDFSIIEKGIAEKRRQKKIIAEEMIEEEMTEDRVKGM